MQLPASRLRPPVSLEACSPEGSPGKLATSRTSGANSLLFLAAPPPCMFFTSAVLASALVSSPVSTSSSAAGAPTVSTVGRTPAHSAARPPSGGSMPCTSASSLPRPTALLARSHMLVRFLRRLRLSSLDTELRHCVSRSSSAVRSLSLCALLIPSSAASSSASHSSTTRWKAARRPRVRLNSSRVMTGCSGAPGGESTSM
mmetsp:Transcript_15494/g.64328  ORF Transcript_15494/g.64328 Transcript_15494/m.64328 type:complete len:201 (-) Transcript_15494:1096-1698(-)